MAAKRCRGCNAEGLRKLLDSDNDDSDFSDNESESEESCGDSVSESSAHSSEESDKNYDDAPGSSKRLRITTQKKQSDWNWTKTDNNPVIYPFIGDSGVCEHLLNKFEPDPPSELSIFLEYMEPLFNKICDETNAYATRQLNNSLRKKLKDDDKWFDTTADEIRAYFALVILMSQVRKSCIQLYWSKNRCNDTPIFRETMSRERFKLISRFLHFTNDNNEDENDKLKKIRPIIQHFSTKYSELYLPSQNIALDESLMKFRGRLSFVQCNRSKRSRFGIKFYKICESSSGYCLYFKIYVGDDVTDPSLPVSTNVVMNMCAPLLDQGHTLYIDNWYSSPDLFSRLTERQTNAIGTVRHNRKDMPRDISKSKLKIGEHEIWSAKNILCVKWRDNKDVYFLSSKHKSADITATGKLRRKRGQEPREEVKKPNCALEYQKGMGGVDLQDQVTALFPIMRRTVKGYRKIFFYLLDMCIFNSFTVYHKMTGKKKANYSDFRINIAQQLLEAVQLPEYSVRGRPSSSTTPIRLQAKAWAHFPMHIPSTEKKKKVTKRCVVCYSRGKRSENVWQCKNCGVALHLEECFEVYHTQQSY